MLTAFVFSLLTFLFGNGNVTPDTGAGGSPILSTPGVPPVNPPTAPGDGPTPDTGAGGSPIL